MNIYLDYAATTPCDKRVVEAMTPLLTANFANPNSPHRMGQAARKALEDARETMAHHLGATPQEIMFTSGGSEANNYVIGGIVNKTLPHPCHIIASTIEHHCIIEPLKHVEKLGLASITWINPDKNGIINPDHIKQAITDTTKLVIVHHANNQIGTLQPIKSIARLCHEHQILMLVDAVQTVGHLPVNVNDLEVDFLSFSGHKFYGPKGIGGLFIRRGIELPSMILGGDQERNHRAGTVNVPGAVGMATALDIAISQLEQDQRHESQLRERIIVGILTQIDGSQLNGHPKERLANNVNIAFEKIDSEQLLTALDLVGIEVSMGSACTSGRLTPSHVLKAIGLSDALALGSLRITVGRQTTDADIDYLLEQLTLKVKMLRG